MTYVEIFKQTLTYDKKFKSLEITTYVGCV